MRILESVRITSFFHHFVVILKANVMSSDVGQEDF